MATYPIRPVAEDELADLLAVDQHASHGTPMSERARANLLARLDFGRTLAAFDGDTIVGGTGAFSFQMRVPGALAAVAGFAARGGHAGPRRTGRSRPAAANRRTAVGQGRAGSGLRPGAGRRQVPSRRCLTF